MQPSDMRDDRMRGVADALYGAEDFGSCKTAVMAFCGSSVEAILALQEIAKSPGAKERLARGKQQHSEFKRQIEGILQSQLNQSTEQLRDIAHWRKLATSDPHEYARQLESLFKLLRLILNRFCEITPYRPIKNERRDVLILSLKLKDPKRSLQQVALLYNKQSDDKLTVNAVERSLSRTCERALETYIRLLRPEFGLQDLLNLFNQTKISNGDVAANPTESDALQ